MDFSANVTKSMIPLPRPQAGGICPTPLCKPGQYAIQYLACLHLPRVNSHTHDNRQCNDAGCLCIVLARSFCAFSKDGLPKACVTRCRTLLLTPFHPRVQPSDIRIVAGYFAVACCLTGPACLGHRGVRASRLGFTIQVHFSGSMLLVASCS